MAKQFVADLAANAKVASCFAVKEKSLVAFRNKPGKFLNLSLVDATGQIKARVWNNAEELAAGFDVGDVVAVSANVEEYNGQLQLIVSRVAKAEPDSYDVDDLIARAGRSRDELLQWLDETIALVSDPHLRALLDAFFGDDEFRAVFAECFGAKALHHAYAGGLLEHTLSVVHILVGVAQIHPELSLDLLVTGGLLHDVGKTVELHGAITADYTDLGKFVGHTVLVDRMVTEKIGSIEGFPAHTANLLSHMLLSHHGEREWGAPIVPATMEACALHYADNLDARVQGFKQIIQAGESSDRSWSDYHRLYERQIYLGPSAPPGAETAGDPPLPDPTPQDDPEQRQPDNKPTNGQLQL